MSDTPITKKKRGRGAAIKLSPEDEWLIIHTYTGTDASMTALAKSMNLQNTYPYRVLDKNGIGWRRGMGSFEDWRIANNWWLSRTFASVAGATNYVNLSADVTTDSVLPEISRVQTLQRIAREIMPEVKLDESQPLEVWQISVTEKFEVEASDIDAALRAGKQLRPGARITSIRVKA